MIAVDQVKRVHHAVGRCVQGKVQRRSSVVSSNFEDVFRLEIAREEGEVSQLIDRRIDAISGSVLTRATNLIEFFPP